MIKEGLYEDAERRDALYKIARFKTTTGGEAWRSLADYVAALRPNQTAIYYALGDRRGGDPREPAARGLCPRAASRCCVLADPVDAFWVRTALGYDGKPFQSVTQGAADLDKIPLAEGSATAEAAPESAVATLAALFKQTLGDKVSAVRASTRLATSAVCLVAPDTRRPTGSSKRSCRRASRLKARTAPVLELNPTHALIKALAAKAAAGGAGRGARRRRGDPLRRGAHPRRRDAGQTPPTMPPASAG